MTLAFNEFVLLRRDCHTVSTKDYDERKNNMFLRKETNPAEHKRKLLVGSDSRLVVKDMCIRCCGPNICVLPITYDAPIPRRV